MCALPISLREALWSDRGNMASKRGPEIGPEIGSDITLTDDGDLPLTEDTAQDDAAIRRHVAYVREDGDRSEEHTSELQSLMRISYAVFCSKKKTKIANNSWDSPHSNRSVTILRPHYQLKIYQNVKGLDTNHTTNAQ